MTEKAKPALTPIKPKDKEIKAAVNETAENDEGMPKNRFVRPVLRKTQKVDEIKETEKGKASVRDRDQEPVNPWKKDAVQKKIPPPIVKPLPPPVKVEGKVFFFVNNKVVFFFFVKINFIYFFFVFLANIIKFNIYVGVIFVINIYILLDILFQVLAQG